MLSWKDIPQRVADGTYMIDVSWEDLDLTVGRYSSEYALDLCPDFQRGHVWTPNQRVAYIEAKLAGGVPVDVIRFNHPEWGRSYEGGMVCVDGLQRLTTALMFLHDDVKVFGGHTRSQIEGRIPSRISFKFNVNNLRTRVEVLRWYLELNGGGTPHSLEELIRVQALLIEAL